VCHPRAGATLVSYLLLSPPPPGSRRPAQRCRGGGDGP
jgi:hypothetical protein